MIKREGLVRIGRFAKPHGVKGEISLVTDFRLFETTDEPYVVCELDGLLVPFFIEEYRFKSDSVMLLKLACLDSEEQVRAFSNRQVYVPVCFVSDEEEDKGFTWQHFIGYKLYDAERGFLGVIDEVDDTTLNVLFGVTVNDTVRLIPVAEELVTLVEHDERKITLAVPQGLFEL